MIQLWKDPKFLGDEPEQWFMIHEIVFCIRPSMLQRMGSTKWVADLLWWCSTKNWQICHYCHTSYTCVCVCHILAVLYVTLPINSTTARSFRNNGRVRSHVVVISQIISVPLCMLLADWFVEGMKVVFFLNLLCEASSVIKSIKHVVVSYQMIKLD
jgi:hypothetical protein